MDWQGAHVVITGGTSGIGLALADQVGAAGATVTALARATGCDVRDRDAVHSSIAAAVDAHGPVDVLVCSAGITLPGRFLEADDETFRSMMEVDYFGTLWPIREVAPAMAARRRGSIVGVASAAALVGVYGYSAYGAAKFAVRGLLESLRTELAPFDVHVGCAYPPDVDTPMLAAEEAHKPPETKAIAGAIEPLSAARVAAAIVRGIERGDAEIYADAQTRALARTVATVPGLYRRLFDRKVRSVAPS